jgi:pseudouridine synthase
VPNTYDKPETHGEQAGEPEGERLQRVLAANGVASRRASEDLIKAGHVSVNGKVVTQMGTRVDPVKDVIRVDGKTLRRQKPRFILLNKPSGFITTVSDEKQRWTVMDLVKVQERVYPVGRLDRETQGLLLLTNDGAVANRVMHPRYGLTKEYHVITDRRPSDAQLRDLNEGIEVNGRLVVPDECRLLRENREGVIIRIVLHEGLYHVVRTMMLKVGVEVLKLRRVRLGPLMLQGVPPGAWRDLTPGELVQLYEALGLPVADADKANARRTIQMMPVGGFAHGTREVSGDAPAQPAASTRPSGTRPTSSPSTGGKPRSRDNQTRSSHSPGRANDTRSPSGNRNRRPRSGR